MPCRPRAFRRRLAAAALLTALLVAGPARAEQDPRLDQAQQLLDRGAAEEALALVDAALEHGRPSARALLLRSTGRIMTGEVGAGYDDLKRALQLDPTLRQGWLNLAGLEIAESRFDAAYEALVKAQELDPAASDNHLNLGAVQLMLGKGEAAAAHFDKYLAAAGASADAYYLVASNYALAGRANEAVTHLRRAVELNERLRLRARSDDRFLALADPRYQELLQTDLYTPPPGSLSQAAAFKVPYDPADNRLLYAVLEALKQLKVPYDATVETTAEWALIWGEMRIKVHNQQNGTGVVSVSAPADRFTAAEWQRRSQQLFRTVYEILGP